MKKVVVLQSNYLPWKGYFDLIRESDLFIFYDDVQFTKNDWRNRNQIKTEKGLEWISVPVGKSISRLVCEVNTSNYDWQKSHWERIKSAYEQTPFFYLYKNFFREFYLERKWGSLSELNQYLVKNIAENFLEIKTSFDDSRNYFLNGKKEMRLLELLKKVDAEIYISGPAGRNYLNVEDFKREGVEVRFKDYSRYLEYPQLHPPFVHQVSIVDLLFNCGPNSKVLFKS